MPITKYILLLALIVSILIAPASSEVTLPVCSTEVHAVYHATGPDSTTYPTWHPQIDPSGCHFDHEHGSNPDLLLPGYRPLYGYAAAKHGMTEGHAGFKGYALEAGTRRWYVMHHFGTANAQLAVCARFHTVDVAVVQAGALVADIHLMADFGSSIVNQNGAYLTPPACPTQGPDADATGTNGVRQFPVVDHDNIGYEPWRIDRHNLLFGFNSGGMTFNTPNAGTACNTISCTANVARSEPMGGAARGTFRFLTSNNDGLHIWATAIYSGTFYTDPTGTAVRTSTATDAVKQYVAPGVDLTLPQVVCMPYDAAAYWYDCSEASHDEAPFRLNPLITGAN